MAETETADPRPRRRGYLGAVAVLAAVVVLWQVTMLFVRRHVDSQIHASVGEQLFAFELQDLDGVTWSPEALRGKTAVLNFFRSRCQGCRIEAPVIRELVRRVDPEEVVVLGIMMDEVQGFPASETRQTLVELGYEHPVLLADEAFLDAFHGAGWSHVTPITYVADGNGAIVAALRGHQSLEDLERALP